MAIAPMHKHIVVLECELLALSKRFGLECRDASQELFATLNWNQFPLCGKPLV